MQNDQALKYLIDEYSKTLITEEFRLRIRARELAELFPFSIHNIYRVLLGIAPLFYEGFSLLSKQLDFDTIEIQELLGLPNRVFRYFHVVLTGAVQLDESSLDQRIDTLESLAGPIIRRITSQLTVPTSDLANIEPYLHHSTADKRLVITLAIYLREYVDWIFMGQHDHGYTSYPPVQQSWGALVLRKFYRLPRRAVPWRAINIFTGYEPHTYYEISYNRFRGDIERLPSPAQLLFAEAVVPEEERSLRDTEIQQILSSIEQDLAVHRTGLEKLSSQAVEQELCLLFSTELLDLLEHAGQDVDKWRQRLMKSVSCCHADLAWEELGTHRDVYCCTDTYLGQLRVAINSIRGYYRA